MELLKVAPWWAKTYVIGDEEGYILFIDDKKERVCWFSEEFGLEDQWLMTDEHEYLLENEIPLPKEPFNIHLHLWNDDKIEYTVKYVEDNNNVTVGFKFDVGEVCFSKDDIIALARYAGVDKEDL